MNRLSNVFQFILGFILGVLLLVGGTAAVGFVFFSRLAAPPEKPVFSEEKESFNQAAQPKESPQTESVNPEEQQAKEQPSPTPSPEEKKTETNQEKEKLPAGAYKAKVNWSSGLSLRAEPSKDSERIGGVDYNTELIILEKSSDGNWEKVRVVGSDKEGWIKSGNVEKTGE
jgi:hypothetical protein